MRRISRWRKDLAPVDVKGDVHRALEQLERSQDYAAAARWWKPASGSAGRFRMALRFISAREEQAGHSRLASLMLLQSRQRTA